MGVLQPAFDVSTEFVGGLGTQGGDGSFAYLPFLFRAQVKPPLQSIELRRDAAAAEIRQRNHETTPFARGRGFGEGEIVLKRARQLDVRHQQSGIVR